MTSMLFYAYCKSQRTPLLVGEKTSVSVVIALTDLIGLRRLFESLSPAKVAVGQLKNKHIKL
ncbi:hypothetical protein T11_4856 [Trichinella zimbabwensis]|uniref:Uncharacterized protein n=1 Tax=Trichinella zimbabwensis TaxID=268475 RepID=A0A0V1H6Q9_9BILA|nr:hypothetical protein T11_4856 [Trichinella zimbabwensis]